MIFLVQNPVWQVPQSVYSLELRRRGCYLRFNLDSIYTNKWNFDNIEIKQRRYCSTSEES